MDLLLRESIAIVDWHYVGEEVLSLLNLVDYCLSFLLALVCVDYQLEEGTQSSQHLLQVWSKLDVVFLLCDDVISRVLCDHLGIIVVCVYL
jgi:hypothetical protein